MASRPACQVCARVHLSGWRQPSVHLRSHPIPYPATKLGLDRPQRLPETYKPPFSRPAFSPSPSCYRQALAVLRPDGPRPELRLRGLHSGRLSTQPFLASSGCQNVVSFSEKFFCLLAFFLLVAFLLVAFLTLGHCSE